MNIQQEIEKFVKEWGIDFGKKRIYRKSQGIIGRLLELFYPPKYPVIALYRFAQYHLTTETGIVYPNFIERNKGNEIADVPAWFELSEEWSLSEKDKKHLYLGPLVQGGKVLIPALPKNGFFLTIWQFIGAVSTLGGAISFVVWLLGGN